MSSIFGSAKNRIDLNENWTACHNSENQSINVSVLGNVQYDMFKAGILPDPFIGENCELWQDACESDYTYSVKFDVCSGFIDNEKVELVFEGIDPFSIIKLNGIVIGTTDNMFKTWRFSVKEVIEENGNELRIQIKAPGKTTLEIYRQEKFITSQL